MQHALTLGPVETAGRRSFAAWARQLDVKMLGPGGWLPDDTSYLDYQRQMFVARSSPAWVRHGRWFGLVVLLGLLRWGGDGGIALSLFLATCIALGCLSFRIERDVRVAARARRIEREAVGAKPGETPSDS